MRRQTAELMLPLDVADPHEVEQQVATRAVTRGARCARLRLRYHGSIEASVRSTSPYHAPPVMLGQLVVEGTAVLLRGVVREGLLSRLWAWFELMLAALLIAVAVAVTAEKDWTDAAVFWGLGAALAGLAYVTARARRRTFTTDVLELRYLLADCLPTTSTVKLAAQRELSDAQKHRATT